MFCLALSKKKKNSALLYVKMDADPSLKLYTCCLNTPNYVVSYECP